MHLHNNNVRRRRRSFNIKVKFVESRDTQKHV